MGYTYYLKCIAYPWPLPQDVSACIRQGSPGIYRVRDEAGDEAEPSGSVLVQVQRPKNQESGWCSSGLKADRPEIRGGWGREGRGSQWSSSKAVRQKEFSPAQERVSLFILGRPSVEWMRSVHIRKGNLLPSVYPFKCFSLTKTPAQKYQTNVCPNIWVPYGQLGWHAN